MTPRRLLLLAALAISALCTLAASASAGRFSISSSSIKATFSNVEFSGGFGTTQCALTLEGSMHARTIPKVINWLIGYFNAGLIGICSRGSATILRETIPWHYAILAYVGTLPNIIAVGIRWIAFGVKIREPTFGIECLARATEAEPVTGSLRREAGGALTGIEISGTVETSCGMPGSVRGTSSSLTTTTGSRITLTLI